MLLPIGIFPELPRRGTQGAGATLRPVPLSSRMSFLSDLYPNISPRNPFFFSLNASSFLSKFISLIIIVMTSAPSPPKNIQVKI